MKILEISADDTAKGLDFEGFFKASLATSFLVFLRHHYFHFSGHISVSGSCTTSLFCFYLLVVFCFLVLSVTTAAPDLMEVFRDSVSFFLFSFLGPRWAY